MRLTVEGADLELAFSGLPDFVQVLVDQKKKHLCKDMRSPTLFEPLSTTKMKTILYGSLPTPPYVQP